MVFFSLNRFEIQIKSPNHSKKNRCNFCILIQERGDRRQSTNWKKPHYRPRLVGSSRNGEFTSKRQELLALHWSTKATAHQQTISPILVFLLPHTSLSCLETTCEKQYVFCMAVDLVLFVGMFSLSLVLWLLHMVQKSACSEGCENDMQADVQ